jgi:serine phosphatase RsbU (regulator of sigma subunit)
MSLRSTRILIVAVTLTIVTAFAVIFAWRASVWSRVGFAGLAYQPPAQKDVKTVDIGMFKPRPRRVVAVIPQMPAARAGIRVDDEIVTINGIPLEEPAKLQEAAMRLKTGDVVSYRIRRGDREMTIPLRLEPPLRAPQTLIELLSSIGVAVAFLAISFLVYWTRAHSRRARVFYAACIVAALFFLSGTIIGPDIMGRGIVTMQSEAFRTFAPWFLYMVLSIIMVTLLLHLALVFPRDHPLIGRYPRIVGAMYLLPFAFPIGFIVAGLLASQRKRIGIPGVVAIGIALFAVSAARVVIPAVQRRSSRIALEMPYSTLAAVAMIAPLVFISFRAIGEHMMIAAIILFVLGVFAWPVLWTLAFMLLTCVALYQSYRRADVEEKRQVRWPLWGTLVAMVVIAIVTIVFLIVLNVRPQIATNATFAMTVTIASRLAYLLIPVSFAFAILKYRLMEIDLIIKKTMVYGLLTAFVVVAYLVLVGGIGTLVVQSTGVENQTVTVVSTLAIAALLIPVRNRLQRVLERTVFRRKFDFAAALGSIGAQITSVRDPDALLRRIAEITQQALQCRAVAIFVKEPGEPFAPAATIGVSEEAAEKTRLSWPSEMLAALPVAFETGVLPEMESAKLRRMVGVYVVQARAKDEAVALIVVGSKLTGEAFDAEDTEFLRSVAGHVTDALAVRRSEKEQQEARQAREIQRALLPAEIPQLPGFEIVGMSEAARAVGGDYYDVIDLGDGKLAFCIADVCGKGMTAALLMSGLQGAVRSLSSPETSPAELVKRVRRVVCRNLSAGKFITFFYAVLDANDRTIRYTNAGHNPPIAVRAAGDVVRLRQGGPILGRLFSETPLQEGTLEIHPGDRVVLFTDGVSEARNEAEEEFGEEALAALISNARTKPAADLQDEIVDAVSKYTGKNFHDDVTLLVVAAN